MPAYAKLVSTAPEHLSSARLSLLDIGFIAPFAANFMSTFFYPNYGHKNPKNLFASFTVLLACLFMCSLANAQDNNVSTSQTTGTSTQTAGTGTQAIDAGNIRPPETTNTESTIANTDGDADLPKQEIDAVRLEQLEYLQNIIDGKLKDRRKLGDLISNANEQDKADLRKEANALTSDIQQLRDTQENIAIGGVDSKLFDSKGNESKRDWREDVSLIAQPILDSLKEITEKPRRIKELNELIDLKTEEQSTSAAALENLNTVAADKQTNPLNSSVNRIERKWQKRYDDAEATIGVARIQLKSLQGDQPLGRTIYSALVKFAKGRGLTILMAIAAALFVWIGVRLLLTTYRHFLVDKEAPDSRTRYRVAKYSVQAFTFSLILIAVFVVFYERSDVLLLGLLVLLIVGFVLNAKQLLPRYIKEARLLLNLGAMREGERVIYKGIPYRVESINISTIFRNPELNGILRIPLSELTKTFSRPVSKDSWFPTSKGDTILNSEGQLLEVLSQNPDTVELKKRGGELLSIPSDQFYSMPMTNLSRHGTFGVTSQFGIDYDLQDISLDKVPKLLRGGIRAAFEASDMADAVKDISVEPKAAGNSSIDYWIFVTMDSLVARSYFRVERIIQTACIQTCSQESWTIPFPHMSVVKKPAVTALNSVIDVNLDDGGELRRTG